MKQNYFTNPRRATRAGFTIIELLVAVGITAMLVTLMLTIVTNVLNGWNRSSGSLSSGNQARTILTQLSQDLQSLVVRQDGNVWMAATVPNAPLTNGSDWTSAKPTTDSLRLVGTNASGNQTQPATAPWNDLSTYRFGQTGTWLRFFTVRPDSNAPTTNDPTGMTTLSAPRAVSYQIVRRKIGNSTDYVYQFFRAEARPGPLPAGLDSTFNAGYNLFMAPGTASYNTADNSKAGNVGNILKPTASQLIGNNVIDFGVRIWKKDPTANSPDFPSSATNTGFAATTADGTNGTTALVPKVSGEPSTSSSMTYGFPVVVEVMVRILTDDGARQIANLESGKITGDWWTIAVANSNVYTRRIEVKSQAF